MSFTLRHPDGTYIREWGMTMDGKWMIDKVELVPKYLASSYPKRSEARKSGLVIVDRFYPGVVLEIEPR